MILRLARTVLPVALAGLLLALPGARAQDRAEAEARLARIEAELSERAAEQRALAAQAEAAGEKVEALTRRIIARAADIQSLEERIAAAGRKIDDLARLQAEERAALSSRRAQIAQLLAALMRLTERPAALALLRPGEAADTLRSAALMRELTPQLRASARALADRLERIAGLAAELREERDRLRSRQTELDAERDVLEGLRQRRARERDTLLTRAEAAAERMETLASEADSLTALIARIEDEQRAEAARAAAERLLSRPAGEDMPNLADARGRMPLPARGRLAKAYGGGEDPLHETGILIATADGAQVIAPHDGRISFAGPFRGYGQLLIITHGGGYHTLLSGMERLFAEPGQWVLAGEPVGRMVESGAESGSQPAAASPRLYMELRKGDEPVDPVPWLSAIVGDVS